MGAIPRLDHDPASCSRVSSADDAGCQGVYLSEIFPNCIMLLHADDTSMSQLAETDG